MPKKGFAVICITEEVFKRAKAFYLKKLRAGEISNKISFSRFMNDLLEHAVENDEYLSRMPVAFQKIGIFGNSVLLKDCLDQIYQVKIHLRNGNSELWCLKDKRNDCIHIGFAYSIPELYRVIRNNYREVDDVTQVS